LFPSVDLLLFFHKAGDSSPAFSISFIKPVKKTTKYTLPVSSIHGIKHRRYFFVILYQAVWLQIFPERGIFLP